MTICTILGNSAPAKRAWVCERQVRGVFRGGTSIKQLEQVYTRRPVVFAHACSGLKRNARLAAILQFKIESFIDLTVMSTLQIFRWVYRNWIKPTYIYRTIFISAGFVTSVILISIKELSSDIIIAQNIIESRIMSLCSILYDL